MQVTFFRLIETCNHVAALLFKVDFAWQNGLTNKSCTSRPCEWNKYGAKVVAKPIPIKEMKWKKPHYQKFGK